MKDTKPDPPQNEVLKKVLDILLSIAIPIIVTKLFEDAFYVALGLAVAGTIGLFLITVPILRWKIIYSGLTAAVAVILVIFYLGNASPKFEVNPIGLSPENNGNYSYYVTDSLIRTHGDLSDYESFTLSPLAVEVVPDYFGDNKYGNLALRVSGSASTKDIPLWTDFDKSSQAQTIHISLADILEVSDISENRSETDTNLMLGDKPYQTASISLDVVRLSAPDRPFGENKKILIKNTPWIQSFSITQRNGPVIDYALTNLGTEAMFHCRIGVTKTLSDVTESDSSFWSGSDDNSTNYLDCPSFKLETGKTHTASFPLNNETLGGDIIHGRYLVQVYTFAERNDIVFNESSYDGSDDIWVVSNTPSVGTFVVCNDPGKTCQETATLPIETKTTSAFTFNDFANLNNGISYLKIWTYPVGNRSANQYIVDFQLDPQRDGWVALGIWFKQPLDLRQYSGIRFKMSLDAGQDSIWLDAQGNVDGTYTSKRFKVLKAEYGPPDSEEQTVVVPFSEYEGIDWSNIEEFNFVIDSDMVPDDQDHKMQISEIEFIH